MASAIKCDSCGADLTTTDAMPRFSLHLHSRAIPHRSNIVYSIMVYPDIDKDLDFCGVPCLRQYLDHRNDAE